MSDNKLLKNLFNTGDTRQMAVALHIVWSEFPREAFVSAVHKGKHFDELELKDRQRLIVDRLATFLPKTASETVHILTDATPLTNAVYQGCYATWVEHYALDFPNDALPLLKLLGSQNSTWAMENAQLALRPFIQRYENRMLKLFHRWVHHKNERVRRMVAESMRPRGVWTAHLQAYKKDPTPILPFLDALKTDDSRYVQLAVANNLNDISKDHPELVLQTAQAWLSKTDNHPNTLWITRHALRTLLKQGHPQAFDIFGYAVPPQVTLVGLNITTPNVHFNEDLEFDLTLKSTAAQGQQIRLDYKIHYLKKNQKHAAKLFRLAETQLGSGQSVQYAKKQSFRQRSTRRHYAGTHYLEVLANGVSLMKPLAFEVLP